MADPNFAWEEHEDCDGVVRKYACADVLLYTALYSEAKLIHIRLMEIGKFMMMESLSLNLLKVVFLDFKFLVWQQNHVLKVRLSIII